MFWFGLGFVDFVFGYDLFYLFSELSPVYPHFAAEFDASVEADDCGSGLGFFGGGVEGGLGGGWDWFGSAVPRAGHFVSLQTGFHYAVL